MDLLNSIALDKGQATLEYIIAEWPIVFCMDKRRISQKYYWVKCLGCLLVPGNASVVEAVHDEHISDPAPFVGYITATIPGTTWSTTSALRLHSPRHAPRMKTEPLTEDVTIAGPHLAKN
jgi:hypothetical protein